MNIMSPALSTSGNSLAEEITTIFVVGFPEDMHEREFNNMFTFSCGFEGATLKIPAATEDDFGKKQIIGFAKFKSRAEALEARDLLSGRRIDLDKGCVLKAEMAKKNLHTKRIGVNGLGEGHLLKTEVSPPLGFNSVSNNGNSGGSIPFPRRRSHLDAPMLDHIFTTGSTGPAPGLSGYEFNTNPINKERSTSNSDLGPLYSETLSGLSSRSLLLKDSVILDRSNPGFIELFDSPTSTLSRNSSALSRGSSSTLVDSLDSLFMNEKVSNAPSAERINNGAMDRGFSSALFSSESLLSRRIFSSMPLEPTSGTNTSSISNSIDLFPPLSSNGSILTTSSSGGSNLSNFGNESTIDNSQSTPLNNSNGSGALLNIDMSDPIASLARLGISGGDQNPPCNTLYVGNLPMDASEEELRNLFSACAGYKRLCFKNKSNGPMCFVEFDDVQYATQALFQLYGNPLSNSTKGGIRLSYSKNPLGVRPTNPTHNSNNSSHHHQTTSISNGNQRSEYSYGDTLIHGH